MILFGYHYQYYETNQRKKGVWNGVIVEPLHEWLVSLIDKLVDVGAIDPQARPDSVIVNYYPPSKHLK